MQSQRATYILLAIFALLAYMPVFGHLNSLPIFIWDEARLAQNAYEMVENGNVLVPHFGMSPDMWNTKPPLLIWLQALLIKTIGLNELAIRLPSAIAAFLTCLALFFFGKRRMGSPVFGFIIALVLVTSSGYISIHGTRTGDYDSLLTLFILLSSLQYYLYLEDFKPQNMYAFFGFCALAILTKSVTGLLILPGLFLYTLWKKALIDVLKRKHFYFGLAGLILIVATYYLGRESINPGYLQAVKENELGGRYLNTLENHQKEFWFYFKALILGRYAYYAILVPIGVVAGMLSHDKTIRSLTVFATSIAFSFLLIISFSQTKLRWYDLLAFPFLAIITSIPIYLIFSSIRPSGKINFSMAKSWLPRIFLLIFFLFPYGQVFDKTYLPEQPGQQKNFYDITRLLKSAADGKEDLNGYIYLADGYAPNNVFYIHKLKKQEVDIRVWDISQINSGNKVLLYKDEHKEYINDNFKYKVIEERGTALKIEIHEPK